MDHLDFAPIHITCPHIVSEVITDVLFSPGVTNTCAGLNAHKNMSSVKKSFSSPVLGISPVHGSSFFTHTFVFFQSRWGFLLTNETDHRTRLFIS